ncbi:MAG: type I-E CRISPR-associated protein Cse2/CasB [Verrucomicrobiae bacterium]|nr:type I-E CRISPR-associated protein Cse2/CasB [Verrucomicrobiae bacterium]MDW7979953.1 type I-E CRISPR-associated protein Cse2/CasB [Verrucomicrobiales bacterium]
MSTNLHDPKDKAAKLLAYLRRLRNDRGAMAALRAAINPARRTRAWPILAEIGGIGDRICETIAALFAYHPEETSSGNLGTTCRLLARTNPTFGLRFLRLLTCDRDELCDRLRPIIFAARAKDIPVNYETLFADLWFWGETVKTRWAKEFWMATDSPTKTTP